MQDQADLIERDLSFDDLRAVLAVALRAGQLLLQAGADTQRVEETVHRLGTALGADWMEVYVTPTGIIASALSGQEHRTRIIRVVGGAIDLSRISAINKLSRRVLVDRLSYHAVAAELDQIAGEPRLYGRWTTVLTVALACACFSQLFGGSWHEFVAVLAAAAPAMALRQTLAHHGIGPLLHVPFTAFVATLIVSLIGAVVGVQRPEIAVPAAVLLLVPGVPLITALSDLTGGFLLSAVARGAQAVVIVVEISVGVALALEVLRWTGWLSA